MSYDQTNVGVIEQAVEIPTPEWMIPLMRGIWVEHIKELREGNDRQALYNHPRYVPDHDWDAHDFQFLKTCFVYSDVAHDWAWYWEFENPSGRPIYVAMLVERIDWFTTDEESPFFGVKPETDGLKVLVSQFAPHMAYSLNEELLHPKTTPVAVE